MDGWFRVGVLDKDGAELPRGTVKPHGIKEIDNIITIGSSISTHSRLNLMIKETSIFTMVIVLVRL